VATPVRNRQIPLIREIQVGSITLFGSITLLGSLLAFLSPMDSASRIAGCRSTLANQRVSRKERKSLTEDQLN
jgi:hypothetical protein